MSDDIMPVLLTIMLFCGLLGMLYGLGYYSANKDMEFDCKNYQKTLLNKVWYTCSKNDK